MQPYDYKLFSIIPLDSDFKGNNVIEFLKFNYEMEIKLISDYLKKYSKEKLQEIFDECISKIDLKDFYSQYNDKHFSHSLGYIIGSCYIAKLEDKTKLKLYYFVFAWYELENLYIYMMAWQNWDIERQVKYPHCAQYIIPRGFMLLFCVGMIIDSNVKNIINGFEVGMKKQKKIHSQKMSENGKKSSSKKIKFITELDIIRKNFVSNSLKSYESKISYIISKYEVSRNTATRWYSKYIKNQSVQNKIDTVKQIPANKD